MSSKKHSNATGPSSRGSASKRRMQLTSYLWKKIGMLWKNYGKAMEFLFLGSVRTLYLTLVEYLFPFLISLQAKRLTKMQVFFPSVSFKSLS